ncbi:hypothetical protein BJ878DRAFT_489674 [Calycina marina]|uniref:C2 domain-containing protein n=1 Tax=Calycina marina TaxID=1763456 RepID=A0A9P7ZAJ1_9HELO|nr:hypothetical protein BJ878DRAFT_489674 [Calycina marina]
MSNKKINGLNHTAGIYSDMTVDGPEIGTLVVIVDRAKNLPSRKSIGKQNPYCAARLGKEAKKTETDRRGGQTPKWDQELRFTVHDSSDYYQLKVSVFNDDKKTDLIGESWINLQEVIVPGGGTNDIWHNLACKGKYAGEVRIEITYYDTRPKLEKPERTKQTGASVEDEKVSLRGPRQPKTTVKRRPLPSDPVTGAPAQQSENTSPQPFQPSTAIYDHASTPSRQCQAQYTTPDHVQTSPRGYAAPSAIPDYVHTPTRSHQSPQYISNQSPLQNVEYNTPLPRTPQNQSYGASPKMNGYAPEMYGSSPGARDIPDSRLDSYNQRSPGSQDQRGDYYEEDDSYHEHDPYAQSPYELPKPEDFGSPPSPGGPPPPPPVHRSRNNSHQVSPQPVLASNGSYAFPADSRQSNAYDSPSADQSRHSLPSHHQHSASYNSYTPPVNDNKFRRSANEDGYDRSHARSNSFDERCSNHHNDYSSMQPTVEDEPPTPSSYGVLYNNNQYDPRYERDPPPAPLNLTGRGSSASGRYSASIAPSTAPSTQYSSGYRATSPLSFNQSVSSMASYNTAPLQAGLPRKYSDDPLGDRMNAYETPDSYGLPPVPPTLVAGMDPSIAQEITDRIYAEKRASYSLPASNSPRGRHESQISRPHPLSYSEAAVPYVPAASSYDDRQSRTSTAVVPVVKPRELSPSPARKSVSPAPPSPGRRLSGVPFGPDSYNILNQIVGPAPTPSISAKYNVKDDIDEKIITHDGREIDPSDHIPASNYAPLLESKAPKYASQLPDRNYRAPPALQNPATGRIPLRQAQRPQSMANPSPSYMSHTPPEHFAPQNGRNRLQKKANRMSAQPAPQSSPLGPTYQDNGYSPTPRAPQRLQTSDYQNENYTPHYGGSPGYRGTSGPPPVPDKIPHNPHNPHATPLPQPGSSDAWALLEEMKNIDLGTGRARRRGY